MSLEIPQFDDSELAALKATVNEVRETFRSAADMIAKWGLNIWIALIAEIVSEFLSRV